MSLRKPRECFDRDFRLKVHFAYDGSSSDDDSTADHKSKLYVKSKWTPDDLLTPSWVLTRVNRFFRKLKEIFRCKNARSNLLPLLYNKSFWIHSQVIHSIYFQTLTRVWGRARLLLYSTYRGRFSPSLQ